jgi:hypothetical protein
MAEIQKADENNSSLTQRFIEFVMLQAQQAALCLGRIPHPTTGDTNINLDAARMFIDHLELVREKTRGNLSKEEEAILSNILSELQMTFVQVKNSMESSTPCTDSSNESSEPAALEEKSDVASSETEEKKKFSKSYGS